MDGIVTDRVTGLAAEVAFFAIVSLPALLLAVIGTLGYFHSLVGQGNITDIQNTIADAASKVLRPSTVNDTVRPILRDVLTGGRAEAVSIGFLVSLWSGSRAMSTYMDAITIAYDLEGRRSWLTKRVLAYVLFAGAVFVGIVLLPLLVVGPTLLQDAVRNVPGGWAETVVIAAYWPVVALASVSSITTLYHVATPVRTPWRRDLPGALLALLIWIGGSVLLRFYLASVPDSAYGSLGAPVAVLLWLYVTALAVLIGAEFNSAVNKVWPGREHQRPDWLGGPQRLVERTLGLHFGEDEDKPKPDRASV
ncbi:MAG: rane protein [Frankiales bacterium]|jgi:membrane protein|nr:rane protein [Frankiales bacterium]